MEREALISGGRTAAGSPKKCESCGTRFGCGADAESCWCSAIKLAPTAAALIGRSFVDCLCPQCLAKYNEISAKNAD